MISSWAPDICCNNFLSLQFQTLIELSYPALKILSLDMRNKVYIAPVCPIKVDKQLPVNQFHTLTVYSPTNDPEAIKSYSIFIKAYALDGCFILLIGFCFPSSQMLIIPVCSADAKWV